VSTPAPERSIAFMIADLSGYTALTEAHGGQEAATVVARFVALTRQALRGDARLVERVGDEVLIAAGEATDALRTALALLDAVEREPNFPTIRVGLHAGAVLEQDGAYYGVALNLAARVAGQARGGQIVCTEPVAAAVSGLAGVACRPLGTVRLRNVAAPVALFEVARADHALTLDPVCRMQVSPDTAAGRLVLDDRAYYFCSLACARTFASDPTPYR
jgi:adenylate cyclase